MLTTPDATAGGILIVWTDIPEAIEADFNAWYDREHLPDRILRMPGFLRGRRYVSDTHTAGAPRFLTLYDLQSTTQMLSEAHTALRKHRTARDLEFVPQFRNTIKGICDVVCRVGTSGGDGLVLLPVATDAGRDAAVARDVCGQLLPVLVETPGVAAALYARRNAAVTQASSARDDRVGDRYADGLLAVETTSPAGVAAALRALSVRNLQAIGAMPQWLAAPCVLRLTFALQKPVATP